MRVLVLGASGMIGNAMFRVLSADPSLEVTGTLRSIADVEYFSPAFRQNLVWEVNVAEPDVLPQVFANTRPQVVINCVGLTKHLREGNEPTHAIAMNALLPHRIAGLCSLLNARLVHVSTDCVFSGGKGSYKEADVPDAIDIYGRSKQLGEVIANGMLTLRTSTIGHEFRTRRGLLEWFLSQERCAGYTRAIFSGLPSVIFAAIVRDIVIPDKTLSGLYHVAGPSITKADLLQLIAITYNHDIKISADEDFVIDRSLDATKFALATGYRSPPWSAMVSVMHEDFMKGYHRNV